MRTARLALSLVAAAPFVATVAYAGWIRPWHLRWGATPGEAELDVPGDDRVPHPMLEATRAVTVAAPVERVWSATMRLSHEIGRRDHAPRHAEPPRREYRRPVVGDTLPTGPGDGFLVVALDEPRSFTLAFADYHEAGMAMHGVLAVIMYPVESGTRVLVRTRATFGGRLLSRVYALLFEGGDLVMVRRLLTGIKRQAETAA